jgi:hypothetical protein
MAYNIQNYLAYNIHNYMWSNYVDIICHTIYTITLHIITNIWHILCIIVCQIMYDKQHMQLYYTQDA